MARKRLQGRAHLRAGSAVVSLVSVLLAAGCSMTPAYERPELPVPAAWPEDVRAGAVATAGPGTAAKPVDWGSFFPDERLRALIKLSLEHNRDSRMATLRVAEARALYGVQRADRLPGVNVGASQTTTRLPADLSATGNALISRRVDVNVSLLPFELDFWGRVASLSEAAKALYLATEQAQRAFRLSLIATVADAYWAQVEAQERLDIARVTLQSRDETRQLVGHRRTAGLAGDLDYLQAEAAYEGAKSDLLALQRQHAAARNYLQSLVGNDLSRLPGGKPLAQQAVALDQQADVPSQVLVRRPDILAAEQRLLAANANIGAARAAFFPRISLTAAAGTASNQLANLFKDGQEAWSFSPSLTLPIFDYGRNSANLDLAEVRKDLAVADYERTVQQAFREVADLLVARDKLTEQLQAIQAQERAQQRASDIAQARYQQGLGTFLEVLDAQRQLFAVQQNLIQSRRAIWSSAAQLYKALGGDEG